MALCKNSNIDLSVIQGVGVASGVSVGSGVSVAFSVGTEVSVRVGDGVIVGVFDGVGVLDGVGVEVNVTAGRSMGPLKPRPSSSRNIQPPSYCWCAEFS